MLITQSAEYALRIMASVAASSSSAKLFTSEYLSESVHCPRAYISKVLRKLVRAKLLKAGKGPGGGYCLAKNPSSISFEEIISAVNPKPKVSRCVFGWRSCDAKEPCILHQRWNELGTSFNSWAKTTTLGQVVQPTQRNLIESSLSKFRTPTKRPGRKPAVKKRQ